MANENVIEKTYQLLLQAIPVFSKFPRSQKFLMADRMETILLDLLELYITAYYSSHAETKIITLQRANLKIENLRLLFRLCHDLRLMTLKQYEQFSKLLFDLGSNTGAWLKSLPKKA